MLNQIDIVRIANNEILNKYTNEIIYVNTPVFEPINIITFGTFDLLHDGHLNIFKKSKDICFNLIVGVSSDSFNEKKGKKSFETYSQRVINLKKRNIADIIFKEESFDEKQYYCDYYGANLLVMGSDWENKFDYLDIPTLYFPRTPNISSTKFRNKLLKNNVSTHIGYEF
jgi:glycerol-3-phosphate cytidylyltransferase